MCVCVCVCTFRGDSWISKWQTYTNILPISVHIYRYIYRYIYLSEGAAVEVDNGSICTCVLVKQVN